MFCISWAASFAVLEPSSQKRFLVLIWKNRLSLHAPPPRPQARITPDEHDLDLEQGQLERGQQWAYVAVVRSSAETSTSVSTTAAAAAAAPITSLAGSDTTPVPETVRRTLLDATSTYESPLSSPRAPLSSSRLSSSSSLEPQRRNNNFPSTVRITVSLPLGSNFLSVTQTANPTELVVMQPSNEDSLISAASRQLPSIASLGSIGTRRVPGHATPPSTASGSNRLPVINRRRSTAAAKATYSKPFPIPTYLRHSSFADRFFTTATLAESSLLSPTSATTMTTAGAGKTTTSPTLIGPSSAYSGDGDGDGDVEMRSSSVPSSTTLATPKLSEGLLGNITAGSATAARILLPTCFDDNDKCALIDLSSDGLTVSFSGSAKYGDRDAAAVRTNRPIPPQTAVYYFEVIILDKGAQGYIGIGFSHRNVSLSRLPGWEDHSWGYHGDDGRAFCCLGTGEPYGPTFTTGDVIGCGIDWTGMAPQSMKERHRPKDADKKGGGRAFFTKNGEFLGYAFSNLHGFLYPSVGLRTPGEIVKANFGAEPFRFDIDALVQERKGAIGESIERTEVPSTLFLPSPKPAIPSLLPASSSQRVHETLEALLLAYFVHHGYSETAQAFQAQITQDRIERVRGLIPGASDQYGKTNGTSSSYTTMAANDSDLRGQIRSAILEGNPTLAITLAQRHYPGVVDCSQFPLESDFDPEGGILFQLRTREFVELSAKINSPSPSSMSDDSDLEELFALGRQLDAQYSSDPRPHVQATLKRTFALLAYASPSLMTSPQIRHLYSSEARQALADQVNSRILVSQKLPPKPELESLYRHTAVVIDLLGREGHGAAALVHMKKELLL